MNTKEVLATAFVDRIATVRSYAVGWAADALVEAELYAEIAAAGVEREVIDELRRRAATLAAYPTRPWVHPNDAVW